MESSSGSTLSRRCVRQVLLLSILIAGVALQTLAQSTATLQGTITDPSGAAVPNAKVVATDEATGVRSETISDAAGGFLFPTLSIGVYKIEISAQAFQTTVLSGLKLDVAPTVTKNVELRLGQNSQTVEVTAVEPLVDVSSNTMGQVIDDNTLNDRFEKKA